MVRTNAAQGASRLAILPMIPDAFNEQPRSIPYAMTKDAVAVKPPNIMSGQVQPKTGGSATPHATHAR